MFVLLRAVNYSLNWNQLSARVNILAFFFLTAVFNLSAQSYQLNGRVLDDVDQSGVISASIKLTSLTDTTQWRGTLTMPDGDSP